ncbi:MAG: peptidoglycan-binding protein [Hyphomicrobiaceae bacterium]|nr:peptidoglycan-binding protein [Hyphomicrobiaceae bacterium]
MARPLNARSIERLKCVDRRLAAVTRRAAEISTVDFQVTEGLRTLSRQKALVAQGASRTLRSRHLTGHAVDVVAMIGNRISWELPLYFPIRDAFVTAAHELGVTIRWGGDWDGDGSTSDESFVDSPHFELPRSVYGDAPQLDEVVPIPRIAVIASDRAEAAAAATLAPGRRGHDVALLQSRLVRMGLMDGMPDGVFGGKTRAAVIAFQLAAGLAPDGICGPKTLKALQDDAARRGVAW